MSYKRLFLLFAVALFVRLSFVLISGFDGLYGQDAYAYLNWSELFRENIINFHIPQKFFYWPVGYFLISTLISLIIPLPMKMITHGISLLSGSLLAPVVYCLAKEITGRIYDYQTSDRIAMYSGFIVCFSGTLIKSSVVIMSDAPGVLLITCSIYFLIKYSVNYNSSCLLISFIFLALSVMTRYAYALCVFLFLTVLISTYVKSGRSFEVIKAVLISFIAGLVIFIPELYYLINYGISYFQYEGDYPTWAASWSLVNFFKKSFVTFDGVKDYKFINSLYYLAPVFHPLYLSVFGIAFLSGLIRIIKTRYFVLIALSWFVPFYVFLSGVPYQNLRYAISYLPLFIIISAVGFNSVKISSAMKNVLFAVGVTILIGAAINHFIKFNSQKQTELEVAEYVKSKLRAEDVIISYDVSFAIEHYSGHKVNEFATCSVNDIKNIIEDRKTVYLIVPIEKIRTQYTGLEMERKLDYVLSDFKTEYISVIHRFDIIKVGVR